MRTYLGLIYKLRYIIYLSCLYLHVHITVVHCIIHFKNNTLIIHYILPICYTFQMRYNFRKSMHAADRCRQTHCSSQ